MTNSPSIPNIGGTASVLASGIDNGMQTFSTTENVRRYMVIFTDATDEAKEKLLEIYNDRNVEITSILVNLSSNEFVNIDGTSVTKNLIEYDTNSTENLDYTNIYNILKGELKNVVLEDYISNKALKYFDYEFVSSTLTNKPTPIVENGKTVGVKLEVGNLYAQETAQVVYKLKLKNNIASLMETIDVNGNPIYSNGIVKATYTYDDTQKTNQTTNTPKVQFIKNFTVTIFAVNEYSKRDTRISDIDFKVTAKDMVTNKVLINNVTYRTNKAGEIKIDGLATLNNIQFTITPSVNKSGYTTTPGAQFELEYDASTKGRIINNEEIDWESEDAKNNTNIYYPITVRKFDFEVDLTEFENEASKLGGVDFKLIQPKLNNKIEMNVLEGTTADNGILHFSPTVMTENGEYEYVLSQESVHVGYDSIGIAKIVITFTNGNVSEVKTTINDKAVSSRVNNQKVLVKIGNELKLDEKFQIKLNVKDKEDGTPIAGMSYDLEVTIGDNAITYNTSKSGENGLIDLNLAGNKEIKLVIKEKDVNGKYIANAYNETFIFERKVGILQPNFIQKSQNNTIEATIDSENNLVQFDLKYSKKDENNVVRVNVVDKTETDINIPNIRVDLVKDGNTIPGGRTNADGTVDISVPIEEAGTYTYTLKLTDIPAIYKAPSEKTFTLTFTNDGKIDLNSIQNINELPILSIVALDENLEEEQNRGALIKAGLEVDEAYNYKFSIKLVDSTNATPIPDAKYNIVIRTETSDGDQIVRKLTNRTTDFEGKITTNLVLGRRINIEVQQTYTNMGTNGDTLIAYKLDGILQEINLTYDGENVTLESEAPHNSEEAKGMGTSINEEENEIIYLHKNDPVTMSDSFLNLHIIKKDVYGGYISGLPLKITTKEAVNTNINGEPLGLINLKTGKPLNEDPIYQDTDINGEVDLLRLIQIAGLIKAPQAEEAYEISIYECEIGEDGEYIEIPESEVTYRIVYRYDEYTSKVNFTNCDIIVGKKKEYSYAERSSYYTDYGFESRLGLYLYPYGAELGNMSLNLEKCDENANKLEGAEYQVNILRPGKVGNLIYKTKVTDKVEIGGFFVNKGTIIEIKEITPPVGYALNEMQEIIEITDVSEDGMITYALKESADEVPRIEIINSEQNLTESECIRTDLTLRLKDKVLETFKFGILAVDKESKNPIENYEFNVKTSLGHDKDMTPTDKEGKTSHLIGGNYAQGESVTYTVTAKQPAPFFNQIDAINVIVYFGENGKVDTNKTLEANKTAPGYGTIWTIEGTNALVENDIDIRINLEAYDKLIVELESVNKITGEIINTIQYNIPESVNIQATGNTRIEVGYVNPGALTKYTINSLESDVKYKDIQGQEFTLQYDETTGDIIGYTIIGEKLEYISHNGKTVKLKILVEPKMNLTVEVETINKITSQPITHGTYTIEPSPDMVATGATTIQVGYFELGTKQDFTIKSSDLGVEYVTPDVQGFKVEFDKETGNIINPTVTGDNIQYVSHDAVARILKLKILVEPKVKFTVEIETIDNATNQPIYGNVYEISESPNITAKGTNFLEVGWVNVNTMNNLPTYTLKTVDMSNAEYKYLNPGDQQFKIGIDENGNIGKCEIIGANLEYVSNTEKIVKLKLKLEPKVVFIINNTAHTTGEKLQGAIFEITNLETLEVEKDETDVQGKAIIYNGAYGKADSSQEKSILYKVSQAQAKLTFARVEDFYILVKYDENRNIKTATLSDINGNTIENRDNIWIDITHVKLSQTDEGYNGNDLGAIIIDIKNYPALRLNFENVDRRDNQIKLKQTKYGISSDVMQNQEVITDELGKATAYIDNVCINNSIYFTIKDVNPSFGYQPIGEFVIRAYFNSEGFVDSVYLVNKTDEEEQVINLNYITIDCEQDNEDDSIISKRTINIKIQNNPKLKVVVNKVNQDGIKINKAGVTLTARELNKEEVLASGGGLTGVVWDPKTNKYVTTKVWNEVKKEYDVPVPGQKEITIEKTLTNSTMEFEVTEYQNPLGYKKPDESIKFTLECDNNGRLVPESLNYTSGTEYIKVISLDPYNFEMELEFVNYEIEKFAIHLTALDTYDGNKKLENTNGLRYRVTSFVGDSKWGYRDSSLDGILIAGRDSDGDGIRDVDYGEDYLELGKVVIDPEKNYNNDEIDRYVRTFRISPQNTPDIYYENDVGTLSNYQQIHQRIEVVVTFNSEGKITNAYFKTGEIDKVKYVDDRYIELDYSTYTLNIVIKHFPMLQIGVNAVDEYTKAHLGGGSFNLQTNTYLRSGAYPTNQRVAAGYIGGNKYPTYQKRVYTYTQDVAPMNTIAPTENYNNSTCLEDGIPVRYIYIYEMTEPNNYQRYEPRHNTGTDYYTRKYLGYVKVYYNELGEIDKARTEISAGQSLDNNSTPNGTYYIKLSDKQYDSKHAIQIDIEYKPTTTLKIHVIDDVSKAELSNIRISPFINKDTTTKLSYEYRSIDYYTSGWAQNVKYWGGAVANSNVRYTINTSLAPGANDIYSEYFFPGQVILNVGYDEFGRVNSVLPETYDQFSDPNVQIKNWDNNVIDVYILFTRKFNILLTKFDEYDLSIQKTFRDQFYNGNHRLGAEFNFMLMDGASTTVKSNTSNTPREECKCKEGECECNRDSRCLCQYVTGIATTIGKIMPGRTVKYTVSEAVVPVGYERLDPFELEITFNENGTVSSYATSAQYEQIYTRPYSKRVSKEWQGEFELPHIDLSANIYDKPFFKINLNLADEFYKDYKLEGGTFKIVSSKGDSYEGPAITDANGNIEAIVGVVYPEERVEYTITQTNTIDGYVRNNEIATLWVRFNKSGGVADYGLNPSGTLKNYKLSTSSNIGRRNININVTNRPIDVRFGINKYDEITNEKMEAVEFKVSKKLLDTNIADYNFTTNGNGVSVEKIDEFATRNEPIKVEYTLSEIHVPGNYRIIEDVVIEVTYIEDGRIGGYVIKSNPSNVKVEVALKTLKYVDKTPVHFALTIPNNNTYDLVIKDEDKNYSSLGIENTSYNVTINGVKQIQQIKDKNNKIHENETDANGILQFLHNTENGRIEIRVAENMPGEGYRKNLANDIIFVINKALDQYKIDLDEEHLANMGYTIISKNEDINNKKAYYEILVNSANNTIVLLEINEKIGKVQVTFKNETKLELTLTKNDINTEKLLNNAKFEVTSQVISPTPEEVKTITTDSNNLTNNDGILYFDLGIAPQNRIVKYTFKEVQTPINENGEQYGPIKDVEMTVEFDSYGKIKSIEENSIRAESHLASDTGNSRDMRITIGNGTLKKAYKLKIVSEDSVTGQRINGSSFRISAQTSSNDIVIKDQIVKTARVSEIMQDGVYIQKNIAEELQGDITFKIEQDQCAQDYVFGNNIISGTLTINKQNVEDDSLEAGVALNLVNVTGFDVSDVTIDQDNNEVVVVIRNDPNSSLIIDKFYKSEDGTIQTLENAQFNVRVEVDGKIKYQQAHITDEEGKFKVDLGIPEYDKSVIYTLQEKQMEGFLPLDEVTLKVEYNASGKIKEYEVVDNSEQAKIVEKFEVDRTEYVIDDEGQRQVASKSKQSYNTIDSRTLYTKIENIEEHAYNIVLSKYTQADLISEDGTNVIKPSQLSGEAYLIQGAQYKITVKEENGEEYTFTDVTTDKGIIISKDFIGHGKIQITVEEISAPTGYFIDDKVQVLTFEKDEKTGKITKDITALNDGDLDYVISEDNKTIYLNPVDKPEILTMYLHKLDSKTKEPIKKQASFEVYIEQSDELKLIGQGSTNDKGQLSINLGKDFEAGVQQKLVLRETKVPEGYKENIQDIILNVEFRKNTKGEMYLYTITTNDERISSIKNKETYFIIDVLNEEEKQKKFNIVVEKHTMVPEDTTLLEGAEYKIKVILEGKEPIQLNQTTNEFGKIEINELKGIGKVRVELVETKAPDGYVLDTEQKYVEFTIDKENGKFEKVDSNVEFDIVKDEKTQVNSIIIKPQDDFATYAMYVSKVDANTKYRIVDNPATFEIYAYNEEGDFMERVAEGQTDDTGLLVLDKMPFAKDEGTYKYYIRETVTPIGYKEVSQDMEFEIEFRRNDEGNLYVANVSSINENIQITFVANKYFKVNVLNERDSSVLDYNLVLEKHSMIDGDNSLIPGATYKIKITQQFGQDLEFVETTNEDGVIISDKITGYGNIRVDLEELSAPNGFKIAGSEQYLEFRKDQTTGRLTLIGNNVDYGWSKDEISTVYVKPRDELSDEVFALYINKVDASTRENIQNNPATFELYVKENGEYNLQGECITNSLGTARVINYNMPTIPGIYKYLIKEKVAPVEYEIEKEGLEYEVEFLQDEKGNMYINDVSSRSEKLELDKFDSKYLKLNFENTRTENNLYTINIHKIDSETKEPILNNQSLVTDITKDDMTAIFRITDENGNEYYEKSNENGEIIFNNLTKPTIPDGEEYIDVTLTVKEVMAPCGYKLERKEEKLTLRFKNDSQGKVVLDTSTVPVNTDTNSINEYVFGDNLLNLYITNEKGEDGGNQHLDRGKYSIILSKIDSITGDKILDEAEFEVALENGERVKAQIKTDGRLEILDIPCPQEAGIYEYVITELIAPTGYSLVIDPQIFKLEFSEDTTDPTKLVITNGIEVINGTAQSVIDITSFANNILEINFEDEKDNETLYLKSKLDAAEEVIYNVFQKSDVPHIGNTNPRANTYTINDPFIDTKTMLKHYSREFRGITVKEFIENLDTNADKVTIYDANGNELEDTNYIATGMTLKATKAVNQELSYKLVVRGDIDGNGRLDQRDLTNIVKYLAEPKTYPVNDLQKKAMDVSEEYKNSIGRIDNPDFVKFVKQLAGEE